MPTYETSYAPNYVPRIRVEVYIPKRHARPYRNILTWLIDEFTKLRGGCSVHENVSGYYRLASSEFVDERISLVYSDFQMDWISLSSGRKFSTLCDIATVLARQSFGGRDSNQRLSGLPHRSHRFAVAVYCLHNS